MIYPRLRLARELLRENGVIFVSIDDSEVHHLRMVMNEVFGEEIFIAELIWEDVNKKTAQQIGVTHEYVLIFGKAKDLLKDTWSIEKEDTEIVLTEVNRLKKTYGEDYRQASLELAGWFRSMKGKPAFGLRRFR